MLLSFMQYSGLLLLDGFFGVEVRTSDSRSHLCDFLFPVEGINDHKKEILISAAARLRD